MTLDLINAIRDFGGYVELQADDYSLIVTARKRATNASREKRWYQGQQAIDLRLIASRFDPADLERELIRYLTHARQEIDRLSRGRAKPPD